METGMIRLATMNIRLGALVLLVQASAGCGSGGGGSDSIPAPALWYKTYSYPAGAVACEGRSVKQTSDGGYVMVGTAETPGAGTSIVFIKTDAAGEIVIEGMPLTGSGSDIGRSVQQTSDGGYVILGEFKIGSNRQMWLIKLTRAGLHEWDRFYGYDLHDEYAAEVRQTSDGGYILLGTTLQQPSNVFLVRTDANGNVTWYKQKGYDDSGESGNSVRETSDHGFVFTGWTSQFGSNDVWLVKVDANGNTVGISTMVSPALMRGFPFDKRRTADTSSVALLGSPASCRTCSCSRRILPVGNNGVGHSAVQKAIGVPKSI